MTKSSLLAVLFDYGNVLSARQDPAETDAMPRVLQTPAPEFWEGYWRYRTQYDLGAPPAEYWAKIAAHCRRPITPQQTAALTRLDNESWAKPKHEMLSLVRQLRANGLHLAVLSNMPFPLRDFLLSECAWMPHFDELTFSCELGLVKPDAAIYHHCLSRMGVAPERAAFIDDRSENVDAARTLGLFGILHIDEAQTRAEMAAQFGLP
jgi:putative hydrolase of the HAD superfamily